MEVPLGRCYDKKSMAPLGLCSARRLSTVPLGLCSARRESTVPLDHLKKSSVDDLSADAVSFCRFKKSMTSTRSVIELNRDEAKARAQETIAIVDRWYDSDDW